MNKERPSKYGTWYGRRLEDLTREELYDVIVRLSKDAERQREQFHHDLDFMADLSKAGTGQS